MSRVREGADPRLQALFGIDDAEEARGVRPSVHLPRSGVSGPVLIGVAGVAALALFWTLETRRSVSQAPSTELSSPRGPTFADPPPLYVPAAIPPTLPVVVRVLPTTPPTAVLVQPKGPATVPQTIIRPGTSAPTFTPQPITSPALPATQPAPRSTGGQAMLVDSSIAPATTEVADGTPGARTAGALSSGGRVRSSLFANRSTTVAQGALITAVLETALDSTRPGFARAIVSRDVRGFDGTQVLIPRGSRLLGDYRSEAAAGQKRAMILWTRLIRPDGVTIRLDSPAADPLGRTGVPANVNNHLFQRLTNALLQSTVALGQAIAGRAANSSVVVALPGSVQTAGTGLSSGADIVPTLRVGAGKSITVFVAHDLEFGSGETGQ